MDCEKVDEGDALADTDAEDAAADTADDGAPEAAEATLEVP